MLKNYFSTCNIYSIIAKLVSSTWGKIQKKIWIRNSEVQLGNFFKTNNKIGIFYTYAYLHIMSLLTSKFDEILISGFKGVTKMGLKDWLTGQKHYTPLIHYVGYNKYCWM